MVGLGTGMRSQYLPAPLADAVATALFRLVLSSFILYCSYFYRFVKNSLVVHCQGIFCSYPCKPSLGRKFFFNDAQNSSYLWIYEFGHMVKDHLDNERENPLSSLHGLLFPISSNGYFISTIPQTR